MPYPKLKNIVETLEDHYMLYAPTPVDLEYFNKKTNSKNYLITHLFYIRKQIFLYYLLV